MFFFQAFEEFVATFQEAPSKSSKVWIKAGTYDAGKKRNKVFKLFAILIENKFGVCAHN